MMSDETIVSRAFNHTMTTPTIHILLTGASGYLGQHLLAHWCQLGPEAPDTKYKITALYNKSQNFEQAVKEYPSIHSMVEVIPKACNLIDYTNETTDFNLVIHAAALSSPRACEKDPEIANALNVPIKFLQATNDIPMIAMSTDQVYNGKQTVEHGKIDTYYQEDSDTTKNPLNVYAKTKVKLEQTLKEIRSGQPTSILRSSIIIGPKAPISPHDAHDTFLHFCASREKQETDLWSNEYRTVVGVGHVCRVIGWMVKSIAASPDTPSEKYQIFNLGGPFRVNRYDMAVAVFRHFGFDISYLKQAQQTATSVPLDISMDCTKLQEKTKIIHEPASLAGLVQYTFESS